MDDDDLQIKLLSPKALAAHFHIGERTLWRLIAQGRVPRPDVSLGDRLPRWRASTIAKHLDDLAERGLSP